MTPLSAMVQRFFDSSALLVWGSVICIFYFSDRIGSYLHPWFHLPTLVTGMALVLLGIAIFVLGGAESCPGGDPDDPENAEPSLWWRGFVWFILTVPLLAAAVASPSQFGATAILNRGLVYSADQLPALGKHMPFQEPPLPTPSGAPGTPWETDPSMDFSTYLVKTEEGRILAETIDLLFAAQEAPLRKDFENKEIEIIGQFLSDPGRGGDEQFQLVRVFIMCCAADGRPIGITVRTPEPVSFPEMSWVRVRGVATFPLLDGRRRPVVVAESVEETDPPRETFIY